MRREPRGERVGVDLIGRSAGALNSATAARSGRAYARCVFA